MTRCAAYIRTSTTKQTTGAESQRSAILNWFAEREISDWDEHVDTARSGADDSREAFRELLEAVRDDCYDDIVTIISSSNRLPIQKIPCGSGSSSGALCWR